MENDLFKKDYLGLAADLKSLDLAKLLENPHNNHDLVDDNILAFFISILFEKFINSQSLVYYLFINSLI